MATSTTSTDHTAPDAGATGPDRRPAPLGRRFTTVWAGQTVSAVGSTLSGVGVSVWVFLETGSAMWLGVLMALAAAPAIVLMPTTKVIDRVSRRTVLLLADAVSALAAAVLLVLALTDRLEPWHLAVLVTASGVGAAFQFPALQASIPELVEPEALGRANGLAQFGPALGVTVGPLVAGPLVGWWGVAAVAAADLVTFSIAVAATLSVRFGDAPASSENSGRGSAGADDDGHVPRVADDGTWRAAARWLRGPGWALVGLLTSMAVVNLVLAGFNVAVLAAAVEAAGADGAGVPLAAGGVAMVVGSIVIGVVGVPRRRVTTFVGALVAFGAGSIVAASRPGLAVLTVGVSLALFAAPAVNAAVATTYHERVPASMQGRVFSLRAAVGQSLGPVGSLLTGTLMAVVAAPAMAADGVAGRTVGYVIGAGEERAAALVLLLCGATLLLLAVVVARSRFRAELDRPAHDAAASEVVVAAAEPVVA